MRRIRLSGAAERDIRALLRWSERHFGIDARRRYERLVAAGLRDLSLDPARPGVVSRPELGPDALTYHLRHSRSRVVDFDGTRTALIRSPRHLIVFRLIGSDGLGVARVLHDSMELERHRAQELDDEE